MGARKWKEEDEKVQNMVDEFGQDWEYIGNETEGRSSGVIR